MARALVPALLVSLLASSAASEVRVQAKGSRLDLSATAAPLADVIDRLARQVGMKVVYDGPAPRQLVTLTIADRTPAEAVLTLLEGQGVNFALVWDETGGRVQTLLLAGAAKASPAASLPSATSSRDTGPRRGFSPPFPTPDTNDTGFDPNSDDVGPEPAPPGVGPEAGGALGPNGPGEPRLPTAVPTPPAAATANPQQGPPAAPMPQFPVSPFTPQPPALTPSAPAQSPTPSPTPPP